MFKVTLPRFAAAPALPKVPPPALQDKAEKSASIMMVSAETIWDAMISAAFMNDSFRCAPTVAPLFPLAIDAVAALETTVAAKSVFK